MSAEEFIITGGKRNANPFSMENLSDCYEAGIYEVDFAKKAILRSYIETAPHDEIYNKSYTLTFRAGAITGCTLYTCTHSEIIKFDLTSFQVEGRRSHRLFNDLHHVAMIGDRMLFACTGLDHVGEWTEDEDVRLYPVIDGLMQTPIQEKMDYRVVSTKPHSSHPNHVFETNDQLWATRFNQKDAICLDDLSRRLDISVGKPHDGLIQEGRLYFTTVNGKIVVFDVQTLMRLVVHDVSCQYGKMNPGWCRGLAVIGDYAYLGFSAFRWTLSLENISFLAKNFISLGRRLRRSQPARIVKYDTRRQRIVDEMLFSCGEIDTIFSVLNTAPHE